ncbi:glycosyltransferase family 2 protein [Thiorhodovibrio litoralis]|uniref:glycosyltransferase family 2 protein n=1 Tax=Thiorhodovibrio litoralis TaxID=2952932 RepID=UPI002B2576A1|nr:glycosyltransferase [Thiorhodovibrio litoralis]WPL10443.1 Glycosyl transferase family 2 [Thiorhodovibrio litoralis]
MKRIGIAIPTYNRNDLLERLLRTIPSDISVFVSDNGGYVTSEMKRGFTNLSITKQSKVISIFRNWNSALNSVSACDYVAIPSDDDLYIKDKFSTIFEIIQNNDADVIIFGNNCIDENDKFISRFCPKNLECFEAPYGFQKFIYGVDVRMPSVFFKKKFLDKLGYFDEHLFTLTAADSELVQRAMLLGNVIFVPEIVSSYRIWSGSLTDQKIATQHWMAEVDAWTTKIRGLAKERLGDKANFYNWEQYQDEIYARNLLSGISNLFKSKNFKNAITHYRAMRYPKYALYKTKLRIVGYLILSFLNQKLC